MFRYARLGLALSLFACGCSSSLSHSGTNPLSLGTSTTPDFAVIASPTSATLQSGGTPRSFTVTVDPANGFTDPVTVSLTGLPAGVTATPATLTVSPGQLGQFKLSASSSTAATT